MDRFRSSLVYESLPNRDGGELKSIQLFVAQGCWHFSTCPLSENSMKIRAAEWKAQPLYSVELLHLLGSQLLLQHATSVSLRPTLVETQSLAALLHLFRMKFKTFNRSHFRFVVYLLCCFWLLSCGVLRRCGTVTLVTVVWRLALSCSLG